MQVVYERCAGLDVHLKTVVACVLVSEPGGTVHDLVRTFSTMTADLEESEQHQESGGPPPPTTRFACGW